MKILLFAIGLVASMATDKNVTMTATNLCYECYAESGSKDQNCFDESKLNHDQYKCTNGESVLIRR